MSNLYVKVQTAFYAHRKTLRLRAAIGDDAYWVPPRLWAYAVENQPDGVFQNYSADEIASLIGYTRDASSMLQALLKAGFMDESPLRIHNWDERNKYHATFANRAKNAAAARWSKPSPPTPSPNKGEDIDKERGVSIPPSLKISERISFEREIKAIGRELEKLGSRNDHDRGSQDYKRHVELTGRQIELRKLLGVTA